MQILCGFAYGRGDASRVRLENLSSWRQNDIYSERETAALAWTEALTLIAQNEISDEFYQEMRRVFDE